MPFRTQTTDARAAHRDGRRAAAAPRLPGFVLGIGFGGFVDGIVLHQILQWHHMLSATEEHPATTLRGLQVNTVADGFFHVAAWLALAAGVWLTLRAWRAGAYAPPWRVPAGMMLAGWGAFNLVEGVVDHHLLEVHHVRDDLGGPLLWDLGFLAVGAALVAGGLLLAHRRAD